jgi:hypothetical protein
MLTTADLTTSQRAEQINFRLWAASVGGLFHFKPNVHERKQRPF